MMDNLKIMFKRVLTVLKHFNRTNAWVIRLQVVLLKVRILMTEVGKSSNFNLSLFHKFYLLLGAFG